MTSPKFKIKSMDHFSITIEISNDSRANNQVGKGEICHPLIDADLGGCMVALPGQLFYSALIPVCLWFLVKNESTNAKRGFCDHRQHTISIDARCRSRDVHETAA